jgi:fatty-acyl-CoA synthase
LCIPCAPHEVGEAVGRIEPKNPGSRFDGYTDARDSEKKILRDVFKPGDAWFRTGDLMRRDQQGYFYFVDRIGDTFRWKGENVATSEVRDAIARCPGVVDAAVYGIALPATDGRAGMAALVVTEAFDLDAFRRHLTECLPAYARPVFLRICAELETTATFKHKKDELVRAGCDPAATTDAIWFNDPQRQAFVPMDPVLYGRIQAGQVRP